MYRYKAADVENETLLTKIIADFKANYIPRFNTLEKYYRVKNEIISRSPKDGKPNNKLAHGFAKYITKMATGYFMGKGIRYQVANEEDKALQEYEKLLTDILDANYTDSGNFEIAKEASKKGIAFEILYIDEKSRLRTKKMNAENIIPVYSQNIGEFLEAAIRIWTETGADDAVTDYADLYTQTEIITYAREKGRDKYRQLERRPHNLGDIPVIVYWNNEEQSGDYEDVISLIDAYDKGQSDTANDSEYFADAYLYIIGASGGLDTGADDEPDEDGERAYRTLRRERVLQLDEKGQAGWLVKDVNDTAQENYKTRLYKDIFFISQVPALSDESFAGNLTGVAIRYKLVGLEELTTEKEHKFMSAQKKKIRIITDFINTKHNKSFNADDVEMKTERNFIDNLTEIIENVGGLSGIISKETQLGMLPIVKDVSAELERLNGEEKESSNLSDYNFLNNTQRSQRNEEILD